ncbi:MAG: hypothetical protein WBW33_17465 [Bryobacteraceae bacterium]
MVNSRQLLIISVLCLAFLSGPGRAQSLTAISDTVTQPNGSVFNGIVKITWTGGSGSSVAPTTASARVYAGLISVLLVPTTTVSPCAYYVVAFTSNDGKTTWTQLWYVPMSISTLTIAQVLTVSSACTGSSGGGGGTGGGGNGGTVAVPIPISDVSGLSVVLAAKPSMGAIYNRSTTAWIDSSGNIGSIPGNATDCVKVNGTSGPCGNGSSNGAAFIDAEVPSGTLNGSNLIFNLSQTPSPATSLELFRNGVLMNAGLDFSLSTNIVTFTAIATPQTNDVLLAYYRIAGSSSSVAFVDGEIPSGSVTGTNTAFTLAYPPVSGSALRLYKNGVLLEASLDYTVSSAAITFINGAQPNPGDTLLAYYRH